MFIHFSSPEMPGQRYFAAAVLLPHAAALTAAVQRQSAAVKLTAHVELLGITVIHSLKCARVLSCIQYIVPP
jgi:hypothetical protein